MLAQDPALDWVPPAGTHITVPITPATPSGQVPTAAPPPAPVTALVGRDVETERVRELVERSRIVTLTGPAGTGKSRLALEVAHAELADRAVWFVDFSGLASSPLVAPTVAAALGVATLPDEDAADAVAHALSRREGVLVLDTCEHVVDGTADLVARVLRQSAGVRVLATSRRPLRITGEIAWPVPPSPSLRRQPGAQRRWRLSRR